MSLADAISASTPAVVTASKAPAAAKKSTDNPTAKTVAHKVSNNATEERPRGNSPAYIAYEAKKAACEARMADLRARIVNNILFISYLFYHSNCRTLPRMDIPWRGAKI